MLIFVGNFSDTKIKNQDEIGFIFSRYVYLFIYFVVVQTINMFIAHTGIIKYVLMYILK